MASFADCVQQIAYNIDEKAKAKKITSDNDVVFHSAYTYLFP